MDGQSSGKLGTIPGVKNMDLGLSEQQELIRRTAREFLDAESPTTLVRELEDSESGYSPELWTKMAALGWLGLGIPPQYGGSGGNLIDQVVLFEEIGRAILPSPILTSTVLSGQVILNAGNEEQKLSLLGGISRGDAIVTQALEEPGAELRGSALNVRAAADGSDHVINGVEGLRSLLPRSRLHPLRCQYWGQHIFRSREDTPGAGAGRTSYPASYSG